MRNQVARDGQWMDWVRSKQQVACCDCGLVHEFDIRIKNGQLQVRAFRNNRATAQTRRRKFGPQLKS